MILHRLVYAIDLTGYIPNGILAFMENNRSLILETALSLFSNYGYEATGVQEICERTGITKPTLYHYFGSKQGLLDAVLAEKMLPLMRALSLATGYKQDLVANITEILRLILAYAKAEPLFYRFQLGLSFASPKSDAYLAILPFLKNQTELLTELFRQAANDHGNMLGREETYALSLMGTANTYALMVLNGRLEVDDALLYRAAHQYMHGIYS
jgi:TetR/AcrR family transcriptional regulator